MGCAWFGGLLFGVLGVGLRFRVLDVDVYESFADGECGDWKLVKFVLYRRVKG